MDYEDDDYYEEDDRPSRSQLKRDAERAQQLGEELVQLNAKQLAKFDLPDKLRDAIKHAQTIHSHSAKKRQLQYIGKLMRDVDTAPLAETLAQIKAPHRESVAQFHMAERWREQLLASDDQLAAFVAQHPAADVQQLRQLVRNARKEAGSDEHGKSYRALFKMITSLQKEQN